MIVYSPWRWPAAFGLCLLFTACQPRSAETPPPTADTDTLGPDVPAPSEDEILLHLSAEMTTDTSLAGRERNAIVNYAMDNMLDVQPLPTGEFAQIIETGDGAPIAWGDQLRVHYRGYFLDGHEFDDSYARQRPIEFYVGNMIPAWNDGLQLVAPGGKLLLITPSARAYGEAGLITPQGDTLVPPNKILVFEVEVLERLAEGE